jgi:hypothetical protein
MTAVFRAIDTTVGTDVIILDRLEGEQLDTLRQRGRDKLIVCPHCKAAVLVRAGEYKAHHFAHWARSECPASVEKPEVLLARAVLYRWLKTKFAEGVTVEKFAERAGFTRPVDCWVDVADGKALAYWIVSGRLAPDVREHARNRFANAGISINWLFVANRIRRVETIRAGAILLDLTPTERELAVRSRFDVLYVTPPYIDEKSLHDLDPRGEAMHTFRGLSCTGFATRYRGTEITTPMDGLLILKSTGEFVHPAEFERLKEVEDRERARKQEEERRRAAAETERKANEDAWVRARAERLRREAMTPRPAVPPAPARASAFLKWEATCVFCGTTTRDWYRSEGGSKNCICKRCRSKDDHRQL